MKRVRCPKCDNYITFDETKYTDGQSLVFKCDQCGKEFGIRIGTSKLRNMQKEEKPDEQANENGAGSLVVIENVFHYKQVLPLKMGDNTIGRYMKGSATTLPIETNDPSIDINHCTLNVSRDKRGKLKYVLRDGPSYTGTFVDNEILGDRSVCLYGKEKLTRTTRHRGRHAVYHRGDIGHPPRRRQRRQRLKKPTRE